MIEAVHLCKRYGAQTAVEDIHFSVSPGEIVGLIGHNGSGKTTTMRMLTGCLEPTSGDVLIDGQSLLRHAELKKQIGYLPEIPPLYPEMTVNEQMCFAAGLRGLTGKAAKDAITTALRQLHVEEVRGRLIRNLSKGYRQRVGFAQAIIGAPMLLVLDEPTVGLDPSQIIEVRQIISELSSTHTILLSSHILTEIAACCTRLVVLSSGHLVADDTPDGLIRRVFPCEQWLLEADASAEALETLLSALPSLTRIVPHENGVLLNVPRGHDLHVPLFETLSKANCPIQRLERLNPNLEDIFLSLTHDDRYKEHL